MAFEYHEEELELKIKGNVHKFRSPSAIEQRALSKKFKEAETKDETDPVDLYVDFFVELGLPKEVVTQMSMNGIMGLFEYAVGAKKN